MCRHIKIRTVGLLLCAVALTATHQTSKTERAMTETANRFLTALTTQQKASAQYDFKAEQRMLWHFVPDNNFEKHYGFPRPGLNYKRMNSKQRRLAEELLSTGLSNAGLLKAITVMSLENILKRKENDTVGRRDPNKYYFSIYGKPGTDRTWAWRAEGHHLSLHYTLRNGQLIASTPTFFGANPHKVEDGARKGLRALSEEEDLARSLVRALDSDQRKKALIAARAPRDILTSADTRAVLEDQPPGLSASAMNTNQFKLLLALVDEYANNMPDQVAMQRRNAIRNVPRGRVFFAWAGSFEPGLGDYYRVQTPSFLIEYDNTQNKNNHSHSVWRDYDGDFGRDLLALHYQQFAHGSGVHNSTPAD
ncbi:MAG: hypothetical protein CMN58_04485 [Solibacterales bacterium]|nr:hypothetical protein [Bryobacterales bacterium]|tara:strand:+ start:3601 stop:4692 length:1092 start_codon:yes stop_codon:yes gene_type:complete